MFIGPRTGRSALRQEGNFMDPRTGGPPSVRRAMFIDAVTPRPRPPSRQEGRMVVICRLQKPSLFCLVSFFLWPRTIRVYLWEFRPSRDRVRSNP